MPPRDRGSPPASLPPTPEPPAKPEPPGVFNWLRVKREFDQLEDPSLWRIHDDLYDLTDFVDKHPGGSHWLELSRGSDITESFEASHVFEHKVKKILEKYHVRTCKTPRKSRFTFHEHGFYKTLKRKAAKILAEVGTGPTASMKLMQDALVISFMITLALTIFTGSWIMAGIAGLALGMTISCAHNFFHQRNTFRIWYWDLSLMNSNDWQVSHAMSHHVYTNTYLDFELTALYPFVSYFSRPKNLIHKYLAPIYVHVIFALVPAIQYMFKIIYIALGKEKLTWKDVIPIFELCAFFAFSNLPMSTCFYQWLFMHSVCGYWLGALSILTTHHHPSIYHAGDYPRTETDWGLHEMDATNDIDKEQLGGFLLTATTFGDHHLHHLFPTVDHSKLHHLYPALRETCLEFGFEFRHCNPVGQAVGMHKQLFREVSNTFEERQKLQPL